MIKKGIRSLILISIVLWMTTTHAQDKDLISLVSTDNSKITHPLQEAILQSKVAGKIMILDGNGDTYFTSKINKEVKFTVGAAIGTQTIILTDKKNRILDTYSFTIDCKTEINDANGKYRELLDILYNSMVEVYGTESQVVRYKKKNYHVFVTWLRDHVHTLKGMKYFYPNLKSGIDLYADSQREDGMIWDNYIHDYSNENGSYWVQRFKYGDFVKTVEENKKLFTRIPIENDVEYLFIEGIYYTWKATGDTEWMKNNLDKALLAVNYSITDTYRWSDKYKLLKRGFTIDTWDFQSKEDAVISVGPNKWSDIMVVKPEYTRFGIMYGDNTGMAASCNYLSEMLIVANRNEEAKKIKVLGEQLLSRINDLAWNGDFYTHHIPEDSTIKRDLSVKELEQVSLSNTYSLNRNIDHEKAVKIIETYRKIRREMPKTSPGEFYNIYPPFGKGFEGPKWAYMNGGVTSIVAGELANGAFEHGYENYGVDILDRTHKLAISTNRHLYATYKGKMPETPKRTFETISLKNIANADFSGKTKIGVLGWVDGNENDLHEFPTGKQIFEDIPFDIVNPLENERRACVGLSSLKNYYKSVRLKVNKKCKSIYFLHTVKTDYYAGDITIHYKDGSTFSDEIGKGKVYKWFYPKNEIARHGEIKFQNLRVAWRGKNDFVDYIGISVYGLNNPHPEKLIDHIVFNSSKNDNKWMVLGVTLSDTEVFFKPSIVSTGIPDNWGAAAVVSALVEGLVGVKDNGVAFDKITLSPRWEAANEKKVNVTIKYPASDGYVSYQYEKTGFEYKIKFTGTMDETHLRVLIPNDTTLKTVLVDGKTPSTREEIIEKSKYVILNIKGIGVHEIKLTTD